MNRATGALVAGLALAVMAVAGIALAAGEPHVFCFGEEPGDVTIFSRTSAAHPVREYYIATCDVRPEHGVKINVSYIADDLTLDIVAPPGVVLEHPTATSWTAAPPIPTGAWELTFTDPTPDRARYYAVTFEVRDPTPVLP